MPLSRLLGGSSSCRYSAATLLGRTSQFSSLKHTNSYCRVKYLTSTATGTLSREFSSSQDSDLLKYTGRVVVVTGAGAGLGRQYALAFAARGASVVVNDLGGAMTGGGRSTTAADHVIQEIQAGGGKAVANYDSVEEGEKLVQTALNKYGKIDILVNNAGILRDKSFSRMSDEDWDLIQNVHLRGSFLVSRAAWPHMKKQGFGRIIMTASAAGIYGNFGQANYSAAKLGLVGLSNTLAVEGLKDNILCNTIAPIAGSRLTETILPPDLLEALKPEYVTPLVLYLCHDSCSETGGLYEVGAGWMGKLRWQRSEGTTISQKGVPSTPEEVRSNWSRIAGFDTATYPTSAQESLLDIMSVMEKADGQAEMESDESDHDDSFNVDRALAYKPAPIDFTYTTRDTILYALGVGMSQAEPDYLRFLYEGADNFAVLPTFGVITAQALVWQMLARAPGLNINLTKLLHGEQYLELYKPLPEQASLKAEGRIVDVIDKGSGMLVLLNVETKDESGDPICLNQFSIFVVGAGNFGGKRSSDKAFETVAPPSRAPDASMHELTSPDQASLYRLSGDYYALHIDPDFAAMAGFDTPILHGLCSLGIATRHVLKQYADNDVTTVRAIKVRFAKPFLPGQTIQTDMWKEGDRVHFQCKVVENGNDCLTGAYIDLGAAAQESRAAEVQDSAHTDNVEEESGPALASDRVFNEMRQQLSSNPDLVKMVKAIFQWDITKDGQQAVTWTMDLKNGAGAIHRGEPKQGKAECTMILSDEDLVAMSTGELNPQQAFMRGQLKIKGNIMLSQKLGQLFKAQGSGKKSPAAPQQAPVVSKPAHAASKPAPEAPSSSSSSTDQPPPELASDKVFTDLTERLEANPDLVTQVKAVFQWDITKDGKPAVTWTMDLKNGAGAIHRGEPKQGKAECTMILSDDDLVSLASGQLNPQQAFMKGQLKINGNIMLSQKLAQLFKEQSKL